MIFKKGDKVFDHACGWGEVIEIDLEDRYYPIIVQFKKGVSTYKLNGCEYDQQELSTLSFTEYTLEGFSQERPKKPLPFKVGNVVYVSDDNGFTWSTDIFTAINKKDARPFVTSYALWKHLALENPLLFTDTKIYTKEDL